MVAMKGSMGRGRPGNEVVSRVKEGATEALHYMKDQTRTVTQQARESATQVAQAVVETVQDEAERLYGRHKSRAVSRVNGLGKVAKQTAHALHAVKADAAAEYLDEASRRVKQATQYLEEQSLTEMLRDAGDVVRRNPEVAAGGLFLVGFAAVRFFKATEFRQDEEESDEAREWESSEQDTPRTLRRGRRDR